MISTSRRRRVVALVAGATLVVGLSATAANAVVITDHTPARVTIDTIPPVITIDPCVIFPQQCTPPTLPPPVTVPPTTMPPTTTPPATTPPTTDTGTHSSGDPVPPAAHAPIVSASPNFTG